MPIVIEIEDIEEMRHQEGIDDVELKAEIGRLRAGDFVKLTLRTGGVSFETLLVRITSIRGLAFRGKLAEKPASLSFSELEAGLSLAFTAAHIHSIPKGKSTPSKRHSHQ